MALLRVWTLKRGIVLPFERLTQQQEHKVRLVEEMLNGGSRPKPEQCAECRKPVQSSSDRRN